MSQQFKFGKRKWATYGEMPQPNSLRWEVMFKDDAGVYQPQTGTMKCRDFFNDLVGWYREQKGYMYGLDTNKVTLNDDGVYIRLTGIPDVPKFLNNIDKVVNQPLAEDLGVIVEFWYLTRGSILIKIPRKVFETTYHTSFVTWLLRMSNYGHEFADFADVFTPRKETSRDPVYDHSGALKEVRFKLPEHLQGYWYYANPQYNSQKSPNISAYMSILHNNGILNWKGQFNYAL